MERMVRSAVRVEPFSTYLERRRKGPIFPVVTAGGFVFVSGLPPFDPATGEASRRPFREQAQITLEQMKRCLEAAGSSLERVVKCNIYCTDASRFDEFNRWFAGLWQGRQLGITVAWITLGLAAAILLVARRS